MQGRLQCRVVRGLKHFSVQDLHGECEEPDRLQNPGVPMTHKKGHSSECIYVDTYVHSTPTVPRWGQKKWVIVAGTGERNLR